MSEKFGTDRHRPSGAWAPATAVVELGWLDEQREEAEAFSKAVRKAERQGLQYGVTLIPEPNNIYDQNAIAVQGFADHRGWWGKGRRRIYDVGYLDLFTSHQINTNIIFRGAKIAAELHSVEVSRGALSIKVVVLAPTGYQHSLGLARRA